MVNLHARSLLDMAKAEAEAKIPDAGATSRPPLRDIVDGLGRALPQQEALGCSTSDTTPPTPGTPTLVPRRALRLSSS